MHKYAGPLPAAAPAGDGLRAARHELREEEVPHRHLVAETERAGRARRSAGRERAVSQARVGVEKSLQREQVNKHLAWKHLNGSSMHLQVCVPPLG